MFDIIAHIEGGTFEIEGTIYGKMTVTPKLAREIQENAYEGQRNRSDNWTATISRDMNNGMFLSNNGQTMVFDEDGHQLDGQHRTQSVIDTGRSKTFPVAIVKRQVAQKMFASIDNGMKRSVSMYLNGPQKAARRTVAAIDLCIRYGNAPLLSSIHGKVASDKGNATRADIVLHNNCFEEYITSVTRDAARMRMAIGKGSFKAYGSFILIVGYCHTDELLREFIDDFCSAQPDSRTVGACVTSILRQYAKGGNTSVKWVLGTLLDAYEHYRAIDDSTMLNKQNKRLADYDKMMQERRAESDD